MNAREAVNTPHIRLLRHIPKRIFSAVLTALGAPLRAPSQLVPCDVIVVLGNQLLADDAPSWALVRRVQRGVDLLRQGFSQSGAMILSGGRTGSAIAAEAEIMRNLIADPLQENELLLETESSTTFENALHCQRMMATRGWQSAIVVTSPYHVHRAVEQFSSLGIRTTGVEAFPPQDYPVKNHRRALVHEYGSRLRSLRRTVRGRTKAGR